MVWVRKTFQAHPTQTLCNEEGHSQFEQGAQSLMQPDLERFTAGVFRNDGRKSANGTVRLKARCQRLHTTGGLSCVFCSGS